MVSISVYPCFFKQEHHMKKLLTRLKVFSEILKNLGIIMRRFWYLCFMIMYFMKWIAHCLKLMLYFLTRRLVLQGDVLFV